MRIRVLSLAALVLLVSGCAMCQTAAVKAPPTPSGLVASEVLQKATASLAAGKLGWVEFRADWCGWCKRMEKLFASDEAGGILRKYYVLIPLDWDRDQGAHEVAAKLGEKGDEGLPWFAVVDAKGATLATSDGPKGNVGFPGDDLERAHFLSVLRSTAKGISPAELESIEKALKASL